MNLFVLDLDPKKAAQYHCNVHVPKLILEVAQFLCLAHIGTLSPLVPPYRPMSQLNNPISKWARRSKENYEWALIHGYELCNEFSIRYPHKKTGLPKNHATLKVFDWCDSNRPSLPSLGLTEFYQSVDDNCKDPDPVIAYRKYYMTTKRHLMAWKFGQPSWFI